MGVLRGRGGIGRMGRRGKIARQLVALRAAAKTCIRESTSCVLVALLLARAEPGRRGRPVFRASASGEHHRRGRRARFAPRHRPAAWAFSRTRSPASARCPAMSAACRPRRRSGRARSSSRTGRSSPPRTFFSRRPAGSAGNASSRTRTAKPVMIDLLVDDGNARFGAVPPKSGSNNDYAIVRLAEPLAGGEPFPVARRDAAAGRRCADPGQRPPRRDGEADGQRRARHPGLQDPARAEVDRRDVVLSHRLRRHRGGLGLDEPRPGQRPTRLSRHRHHDGPMARPEADRRALRRGEGQRHHGARHRCGDPEGGAGLE